MVFRPWKLILATFTQFWLLGGQKNLVNGNMYLCKIISRQALKKTFCLLFNHFWLLGSHTNGICIYVRLSHGSEETFRLWKSTILAIFNQFWLLGGQKNFVIIIICIYVRLSHASKKILVFRPWKLTILDTFNKLWLLGGQDSA